MQANVKLSNVGPEHGCHGNATLERRLVEVDPVCGAHEAMAYRDWLEGKVGAARAGLADGSNQVITDEAWTSVRAAKLKQRAAAK